MVRTSFSHDPHSCPRLEASAASRCLTIPYSYPSEYFRVVLLSKSTFEPTLTFRDPSQKLKTLQMKLRPNKNLIERLFHCPRRPTWGSPIELLLGNHRLLMLLRMAW